MEIKLLDSSKVLLTFYLLRISHDFSLELGIYVKVRPSKVLGFTVKKISQVFQRKKIVLSALQYFLLCFYHIEILKM